MKTIREYRDLIIFILVLSVNLVCWYVGGIVMSCVLWGVSVLYITYVIHDLYTERERYYFVSFRNSETGIGNSTFAVNSPFNIRDFEDHISEALGGGKTVVLFYQRMSKKEHLLAVEHDSRKKD